MTSETNDKNKCILLLCGNCHFLSEVQRSVLENQGLGVPSLV